MRDGEWSARRGGIKLDGLFAFRLCSVGRDDSGPPLGRASPWSWSCCALPDDTQTIFAIKEGRRGRGETLDPENRPNERKGRELAQRV